MDTIVVAAGIISRDELYQSLRETMDEVINIGDSAMPGKIIDAVWAAYGKSRLI